MTDAADRPLARLGDAVASALDATAPTGRLAAQRARFLASASQPRRSARRGPALAAACALAILAVHRGASTRPATPSLTARSPAGDPLAPGAWLSQGDPILFSDQSAVRPARGAQVRLGALGPDGAEVTLERGEIEVAITHRARTRWRFFAGPWTVTVTGTAFRLGWSPTNAQLDLTMREGRVSVSGPRTPGGRAVVAGERVVADDTRGVVAFVPPPPIARAAPPTVVAAPSPERIAPQGVPRRPRPARAVADAGSSAAQSAREVPRDDAQSALAAADRARFTGRVAEARELLLALRARFAGTPEATRAAHNLGVLSLESLGAPAVAARWFEIALREAPDGPLWRESLGRRVQALRQAGDEAAAREAAARYLALDPDGAFAPFAQSVLAR